MEGLIKQIILTGRFIAKGVALPPYIMKQMKKLERVVRKRARKQPSVIARQLYYN